MPALVLWVVQLLLGKNSHLTSGAHYFWPAASLPPEVSGAVVISQLLEPFLQHF